MLLRTRLCGLFVGAGDNAGAADRARRSYSKTRSARGLSRAASIISPMIQAGGDCSLPNSQWQRQAIDIARQAASEISDSGSAGLLIEATMSSRSRAATAPPFLSRRRARSGCGAHAREMPQSAIDRARQSRAGYGSGALATIDPATPISSPPILPAHPRGSGPTAPVM